MNKCKDCKWWFLFPQQTEDHKLADGACHLNPGVLPKTENSFCSHWEGKDENCWNCSADIKRYYKLPDRKGVYCEECYCKLHAVAEVKPQPKPGEWWWVGRDDKETIVYVDCVNCDGNNSYWIRWFTGSMEKLEFALKHYIFLEKVPERQSDG